MKFTFTDGTEIINADMCGYCQLDTGGQHQWNCPCLKISYEIAPEIKSKVRIFRIEEEEK